MVEVALAMALLASVLFSARDILVKKSLVSADLYSTLLISLLFATPFSAVAAFLDGELVQLVTLPLSVVGYFAVAGVMQFVVTRGFYYAGIGVIGASRTLTLVKVDSALSVVFAVVFLREVINMVVAVSVATIMLGVFLVSLSEPIGKALGVGEGRSNPRFLKGLVLGVLTAVFSGLVPLLIRLGAMERGIPLLGFFLASLFALAVVAPLSLAGYYRRRVTGLRRETVRLVTSSAFFATGGQMAKFAALAFAPVVFVAPILNTQLLLTVLFSLLFIQRMEQVNAKVILGAALVIVGIATLALKS